MPIFSSAERTSRMVVEEGRPLSSAVQSSYTTVGQSKQFWREDWWEGGRTERKGRKEVQMRISTFAITEIFTDYTVNLKVLQYNQ